MVWRLKHTVLGLDKRKIRHIVLVTPEDYWKINEWTWCEEGHRKIRFLMITIDSEPKLNLTENASYRVEIPIIM